MTLDYIFWLDKETGDHETLFQDGQSRGYQTVSMCLAGDPGDPRFTTVMINDSTVVQEQFFLLTPANWTTTRIFPSVPVDRCVSGMSCGLFSAITVSFKNEGIVGATARSVRPF